MEIQVRSRDGSLGYVNTVHEAFTLAEHNKAIWKISWSEGDLRVRFVRASANDWRYDPMMAELPKALAPRREHRKAGNQ